MANRGDTIGVQSERQFAVSLRQLREQQGISQAALAKKLEWVGIQLDSTAITRIEKHADGSDGMRVIRLGEAVAIAHVLGVSLGQMLIPTGQSIYTQLNNAMKEYTEANDLRLHSYNVADAASKKVRELQSRVVGRTVLSNTEILRLTREKVQDLITEWTDLTRSFEASRAQLAEPFEGENEDADNEVNHLEQKLNICNDMLFRLNKLSERCQPSENRTAKTIAASPNKERTKL